MCYWWNKSRPLSVLCFLQAFYMITASECSMLFLEVMFPFVSNFRHVSVCGIFSPPLPKNYTTHLTCSSSAQSHPKPCQLHGAHNCIWPGHSHNPERDCRRDHLLLHRQHPGTNGRDGMCFTQHPTLYFIQEIREEFLTELRLNVSAFKTWSNLRFFWEARELALEFLHATLCLSLWDPLFFCADQVQTPHIIKNCHCGQLGVVIQLHVALC